MKPGLTIEFIDRFPEKPWKWYQLSLNDSFTMKDILQNHKKPWDWYGVTANPNTLMKHVTQMPLKQWDWEYISMNYPINNDLHFLLRSQEKLNWHRIMENRSISIDFILRHQELPWYMDWIVLHPLFDQNKLELIKAEYTHIINISWFWLCMNKFIPPTLIHKNNGEEIDWEQLSVSTYY